MAWALLLLLFRMPEGFQMSGSAYAMMDERCWINDNVVADNGLGMVRHPTESSSGVCLVRGALPANGACGNSNTVMFNPKYTKQVGMETVDARQECVVRVVPSLTDQLATAYNDSLVLDNVTSSDAYAQIVHKYEISQQDISKLQEELRRSRSDTDTANQNWKTQISRDNETMSNALGVLRDQDARALSDAGNSCRDSVESTKRTKDAECDARLSAKDKDCDARLAAKVCIDTHAWVMFDGQLFHNEMDRNPADSVGTCKDRCANWNGCTHFTYNRDGHLCYLQSNLAFTSDNGSESTYRSGISIDKYPLNEAGMYA